MLSFTTLLLIWMLGAAPADLRVHVPRTSSAVLIDGNFSPGEWDKAASLEVPNTARLYFQQSADFVYIAIQYTNAPSGIVDLYLSQAEGEIFDLHASAKLGERQLHGNAFPEWTWWNNRDWIANPSHVDSFEKRTFLPSPIREYQIRRSRFPSDVWRLRLELTAMTANHEVGRAVVFPPKTDDKSTQGWLELDLK